MTSYKMLKMNGEDDSWFRAPLVCRRCGKLMSDLEPMNPTGEYVHQKRPGTACVNDEKTFYLVRETQLPAEPREVEVFKRKRLRRATERSRIASRKARKRRT